MRAACENARVVEIDRLTIASLSGAHRPRRGLHAERSLKPPSFGIFTLLHERVRTTGVLRRAVACAIDAKSISNAKR